MKKTHYFIVIFFLFLINFSNAEIIDNKKIVTKKFDVWTVSCEDDEMFRKIKCRMFVEITDKSTMFINPNNSVNKILIISKDIYPETRAFIKVDDNNLLDSRPFIQNKFSFLKFDENSLGKIYNQMRVGNNFFIRYTIKDNTAGDGYREITVKVSLGEFQNAFNFFLKQRNKYDNKK